MSDQRGKVLSFGPFELSIGNRLLTNGATVVPLGARAMDLLIVLVEQANLQSECSNRRSLGRQAGRGQRSRQAERAWTSS
jgi:hypothetical protein